MADAKARYGAAIKAAEERFQNRIDEARQDFLKEVASARSLLVAAPGHSLKPISLSDLPVEVTGAEPVPLEEGKEQAGWFEIPRPARGSLIFEPKASEPKDGVVQFTLKRDAKIGLAASWAYDGNASGGWQEDRLFKQDLLDGGWSPIGQMYRNQTDRHTLFVRDCKKGEVFAIRTRKFNRPFVFVPGVIPAEKQAPILTVQTDQAVEVVGAEIHNAESFLPEQELPGVLEGSKVFESTLSGVAILRIHQPVKIYVAASWDYDGNTSGQWTEERWSEQAFVEDGFEQIGRVIIKHRGSNQEHTLFVRQCKAGESFRIRTRKYGAPYVFLPASS